jgi:hypothetical protein
LKSPRKINGEATDVRLVSSAAAMGAEGGKYKLHKVNEKCGRFRWTAVACSGEYRFREVEQIESVTKVAVHSRDHHQVGYNSAPYNHECLMYGRGVD